MGKGTYADTVMNENKIDKRKSRNINTIECFHAISASPRSQIKYKVQENQSPNRLIYKTCEIASKLPYNEKAIVRSCLSSNQLDEKPILDKLFINESNNQKHIQNYLLNKKHDKDILVKKIERVNSENNKFPLLNKTNQEKKAVSKTSLNELCLQPLFKSKLISHKEINKEKNCKISDSSIKSKSSLFPNLFSENQIHSYSNKSFEKCGPTNSMSTKSLAFKQSEESKPLNIKIFHQNIDSKLIESKTLPKTPQLSQSPLFQNFQNQNDQPQSKESKPNNNIRHELKHSKSVNLDKSFEEVNNVSQARRIFERSISNIETGKNGKDILH